MIAGLVLVALLVVAGTADRTGLPGVIALVVVSVLWLFANQVMEGPVLWIVSPGHGLTAADLAGLAGLVLAAWRFGRWIRDRGQSRSRTRDL